MFRVVALLNVDQVSVRFGGLQALAAVTIDVPENEVTGLIGPNGAGKTTLFNVITGLQPPTGGTVVLDGKDITNVKPHQRARLGIGRTFQRLETFGTLSVRDNVLVAAEMRTGWSREKFKPGVLADELIERVGLTSVAPGARRPPADRHAASGRDGAARSADQAAGGAARRAVVGSQRGRDRRASPSCSSSSPASGLAILLVEHDMGLVMSACHHIHVLDFGQIIAYGTPTEVQANPLVRAAYLGEGDEADEVPEEQQALLAEVSALQEEVRAETEPTNGADADHLGVGARAGRRAGVPTEGAALELIDVRAAYGVDRRAARREHHDPAAARSTRCSGPTARASPPR